MFLKRHSLQIGFALSTALSFFWLWGLVVDAATERESPLEVLVGIAVGLATAVCFLFFRGGRLLVPQTASVGDVLGYWAVYSVLRYLLFVPVCGVLAWLLLQAFSPEPKAHDAPVFVVIFALWFPLWLAPAAGALRAWRRLASESSNSKCSGPPSAAVDY